MMIAGLRTAMVMLISAGLLVATLGTVPANAAAVQMSATAGVNIRSGPSTSTKIVGGLYRGQTVTAVSSANGWTKIRFRGGSAYIASRYLTRSKVAAPATVTGNRVTTTDLNLRRGPGLSYRILRVLREGTSVNLTGRSARGYVEVEVGSAEGWVSTQYLAGSASGLPTVIRTRLATADLVIRSSSGSNYRVIDRVKKGTRLSVTGTTQNGRAQIIYRNRVRWVTARYLSNTSVSQPSVPGLPPAVGARYATRALNIWTSATGSSRVDEVPRGERLRITGRTQSGRAQVIYNNAVRWVTSRYLSTTRVSQSAPAPSSYPGTERRLTAKTITVHRELRAKVPQIRTVGGWRPASSGEHPLGRALDVMIPNYQSASGRDLGYRIANWAQQNARRLDINYVVWRQRIWNIQRDGEGWRFMADRGGDSANHINHVHISVFA
jgi:uncharacterized protein YgiM (DUF1202 family)